MADTLYNRIFSFSENDGLVTGVWEKGKDSLAAAIVRAGINVDLQRSSTFSSFFYSDSFGGDGFLSDAKESFFSLAEGTNAECFLDMSVPRKLYPRAKGVMNPVGFEDVCKKSSFDFGTYTGSKTILADFLNGQGVDSYCFDFEIPEEWLGSFAAAGYNFKIKDEVVDTVIYSAISDDSGSVSEIRALYLVDSMKKSKEYTRAMQDVFNDYFGKTRKDLSQKNLSR